jgi:hypothetical protein
MTIVRATSPTQTIHDMKVLGGRRIALLEVIASKDGRGRELVS